MRVFTIYISFSIELNQEKKKKKKEDQLEIKIYKKGKQYRTLSDKWYTYAPKHRNC